MTETTITLRTPIQRADDTVLETVTLRKPTAGDLRGLMLAQILTLETDTLNQLLKRISDLTERDLLNMDPLDYTTLATHVLTFFVESPAFPSG